MLQPGFTVTRVTHGGAGRFHVALLNSAGEAINQLANGTGAWNGSRSFIVLEAGEHAFDVIADGDWTIEVARVDTRPELARNPPAEINGTQYQSLYFFQIVPGPYTISITCESGPVRVITTVNALRNRRTVFTGDCPVDTTIELTSDIATDDMIAIDIMAVGQWTVVLRH
jgi:hypothetical protein